MSGIKIDRANQAIVRATTADLFPKVLTSKLVAGAGITKTILNPGADEQIQLSTAMTSGQVDVSVTDTTPGFLSSKIVASTGISLAILNGGGNEQLQVTNSTSSQVKVTTSDTTPAVLNSKITAGNWVAKSTLNPAGNEQLNLAFANTAAVSISALDISWADPNFTFFKTLGANSTFTFSNTSEGKTIVVALTNTGSNFTVTWPAGIKWQLGTPPVQTIGAKTDIYTFIKINSIIYGAASQNYS